MKEYFSSLHYKNYNSPIDIIVLLLLFPISLFYGIGSETKNLLYKLNMLKKHKAKAYTISIGNLTTGGVGKTPIVKEIAKYFSDKNVKTAILSRGYGSELDSCDMSIISDGKDILFNAQQAGDEPYWLAKNCKNTAVLTCTNRCRIAEYATEKLKCDILILDDGFQHQKLARDLDIVVIDYEKKFGNKLLLPAGPLRECIGNILRADKIIVMNKTHNIIDAKSYCEKLRKKFKKTVIPANLEIDYIYGLMTKLEVKNVKRVLAFCGIGQPQQFFNQLKDNEYELGAEKIFQDHHKYTIDDIKRLSEFASQNQCEQLITTEKDAVKIKELLIKNNFSSDKEILVVKLKLDMDVNNLLK